MRHQDVSPTKTPPWAAWRCNLGDHWATINYLITRSFTLREEQVLSRYQHWADHKKRFEEILALLEKPERSSVVLTDEKGTHEPEGWDVWAGPVWPTLEKWNVTKTTMKVCYQFDGLSSAESKNPSPEDATKILSTCLDMGFTLFRCGKDSSLAQIVHEMATSFLFIGCDSGMSHVAHSVGVPTILVEYKLPIITTHRHKHFIHAKGTDELIRTVKGLL